MRQLRLPHFFILQKEGTHYEKALSLILALVLCLSLCACGGGGSDDSGKIALTKENINTYFTVACGISDLYSNDETFEVNARLNGASENFNYENISVTFKISRNARCFKANPDPSLPPAQWTQWDHEVPYEAEVTVTTNIAGMGETVQKFSEQELTCSEHNQLGKFEDNAKSSWEIIAISGYLVPAG